MWIWHCQGGGRGSKVPKNYKTSYVHAPKVTIILVMEGNTTVAVPHDQGSLFLQMRITLAIVYGM